jgi:hypothetical protein
LFGTYYQSERRKGMIKIVITIQDKGGDYLEIGMVDEKFGEVNELEDFCLQNIKEFIEEERDIPNE